MRYDQSYRKTLLLGGGMVGQDAKKGQHERIPLIKAQYMQPALEPKIISFLAYLNSKILMITYRT